MTRAVPSPQLEEIPATPKGWIVEEAPHEEPCRGILVEEVHVDEADTSFVSTTPPKKRRLNEDDVETEREDFLSSK